MLASSLAVTGTAVLGGTGILPSAASGSDQQPPSAAARLAVSETTEGGDSAAQTTKPAPGSERPSTPDSTEVRIEPARDTSLPADSGEGRRIVFSEGRQRVWLVEGAKRVTRTYLVSGSMSDNLDPGTYSVYSRSQRAYGIDDSGTMKYFVRFTQGDTAAIGFHDIPIDDGVPVQTVSQLGTPLSHGCIRQKRPDAIALWKFAPIGTTVVVTA